MQVYGIEVTKSDRIEFLADDLTVKLSRLDLQCLIEVLSDDDKTIEYLLNLLVMKA